MKYLFLLTVVASLAQPTLSVAQDSVLLRPKFVLVQLSSEKNRIEALAKNKRYSELEIVKKDAKGTKDATITDFKRHFDRYPVYFYIDTNINAIKARQFSGVLFDTAGNAIGNRLINENSQDYLIVYYGLPTTQPRSSTVVDASDEYSKLGEPNGKGLIICNYLFQQVMYFYKLGSSDLGLDKNKYKGCYYFSKKFDIEYFPLAQRFNKSVPNLIAIRK
jgi:hypothetical protein